MGTYFAHAAITVKDTEKSLEFYRDLMGLKLAVDFGTQPAEMKTGVKDSKMRVMLLSDDKGSQCIETFEFYDTESRRTGEKCLHTDYFASHIAFAVDDCEALYNKLVDAGVEVSIPLVDAGGYKFAYVYDYDGFLVELIEASTY